MNLTDEGPLVPQIPLCHLVDDAGLRPVRSREKSSRRFSLQDLILCKLLFATSRLAYLRPPGTSAKCDLITEVADSPLCWAGGGVLRRCHCLNRVGVTRLRMCQLPEASVLTIVFL